MTVIVARKPRTSNSLRNCPGCAPHTNMPLPISLLAILAGVSAALAQGTGDAFVAKIPGANLPSTVTISASGANGVPGQSLQIPIVLSLGGTTAPGNFQIDLNFDSTKLAFVSASGLSSNVLSSGDVRLATPGTSQSGIASGVVGYATFTMSASFGTAATMVNLMSCLSADPQGNLLSTGCSGGTVGVFTCAVTGDSSPSVTDVQAMINQTLGVAPPVDDMNRDGVVNVADIEKVVSAAIGRGCVY